MFETSVVQARVQSQRRFGLLTASLTVHTLAIIGVVSASVASVRFPNEAPKELPAFSTMPVVDIPMPKGRPDAPPKPPETKPESKPVQAAPKTATAPQQLTAPDTIPDSVQPVQPATNDASIVGPIGDGSDRRGVPDGDPNVVDIGQETENVTPAPNVIYRPGADVKSAVVITRVDPTYPRAGIAMRLNGWAVVRCIIDTNGRCHGAEVVQSSHSMFEGPALDAVQQWRFIPGQMKGRAVDTYFELTVKFNIK